MRHLLVSLLFFLFPLITRAQSTSTPDFIFRGTSSLHLIGAADDAFLGFGLGVEARLGNRFSVGGDVTFGESEFAKTTIVQPHARWYLGETFSAFFLETGATLGRLNAKDNFPFVGPPFPLDRGTQATFYTFDVGLGFATLVKNHWSVGFSLGAAFPVTDLDLETSLYADFSVGYAF